MAYDPKVGETFLRTLGKRGPAPIGAPPSAEARAAMTRMANYKTSVPKGIFIYASHEAANADWERWRTLGMLANTRVKPGG